MSADQQGMSSVYFNKGENCIAAGRLFVEESIHDEFISRVVSEPKHRIVDSGHKHRVPHFPQCTSRAAESCLLFHHPFFFQVEEIKKMKIGDPLDRSTDHGPQNHKAHMDKLLEYCEVGVKEGATLVYGGKRVDRPGRTHTEHRVRFTDKVREAVMKTESSEEA